MHVATHHNHDQSKELSSLLDKILIIHDHDM